MNHLFKQLYSKRKIPEELEKEILNSFETLKMIGEITSLFTEKFGKAEYELHAGLEASLRESTLTPPPQGEGEEDDTEKNDKEEDNKKDVEDSDD